MLTNHQDNNNEAAIMGRTPLRIIVFRTLAVITLLAAWIYATTKDYDNHQKEAEYRYCQMVAINKINPAQGWTHDNKSIICE